MLTFDNLTPDQERVLIKLLKDTGFQLLLGTKELTLTEAEEEILWDLINNLPDE